MSLALYRKYRSKSFETVVGQDHITKTLKNSVDDNTFTHAYLLTGLRGVGKTSIARIFAAYVNGIDYEETENNPDIVEIDAASNRKIDEIRDLRERVNIAPSNLKYKIYIIDEVHMLTREAFNALLKTLEEPPKHCILILATTDYHKLPETIISRCTRFSFKAISSEDIIKHLQEIASKEKIKVEKEALQTIAENSSGSLRDAITIFDQARNVSSKITSNDVELLLGLASRKLITDLYDSLMDKDIQKITKDIETIRNSGANSERVISQFTNTLRNKIIHDTINAPYLLELLTELMKVGNYSEKWLAFEVCLLKHAVKHQKNQINDSDLEVKSHEVNTQPKENTEQPSQPKKSAFNDSSDLWQKVLNELKETNSTLYGVARMAEVFMDGEVLELRFKFNFHKKQLDIKHNQMVIFGIINKHSSKIKSLNTVAIKEENAPEDENKYDNSKDVSNISNIFGSAEMLE